MDLPGGRSLWNPSPPHHRSHPGKGSATKILTRLILECYSWASSRENVQRRLTMSTLWCRQTLRKFDWATICDQSDASRSTVDTGSENSMVTSVRDRLANHTTQDLWNSVNLKKCQFISRAMWSMGKSLWYKFSANMWAIGHGNCLRGRSCILNNRIRPIVKPALGSRRAVYFVKFAFPAVFQHYRLYTVYSTLQ